jgi:hypothetical protein
MEMMNQEIFAIREISSFATSNEWEILQSSGEFCNVCAAIEGILRALRGFVLYLTSLLCRI